jgi:hypothetical protein
MNNDDLQLIVEHLSKKHNLAYCYVLNIFENADFKLSKSKYNTFKNYIFGCHDEKHLYNVYDLTDRFLTMKKVDKRFGV